MAEIGAVLTRERARYGAGMSNDECVELLNAVAWEFWQEGWGLLRKPSGNNGTRRDGVLCSVDYLVHGPSGRGYDVLRDAGAGGPSVVQWSGEESPSEQFGPGTDRWVGPIAPASLPTPAPPPPSTPPPTPPAGDLTAILTALTAIQQALNILGPIVVDQSRTLTQHSAVLATLQAQMDRILLAVEAERGISLRLGVFGQTSGVLKPPQT